MRLLQRSEVAIRSFLLGIIMVALSACVITDPVNVAETPAQKAYAISATYNILLESARDLVVDESVSLSVRRAIQNAEAVTTPVLSSLEDAYVDYVVARAKFDQGQSTQEQLTIVADNLMMWITQAERALIRLATAIG